MELLDVVIRLEDARKLDRNETLSVKRPFKKSFKGGKHKFSKRKFETKEEAEGGMSSNPQTPKGPIKWVKWIGTKDVIKKGLYFKYGNPSHMTKECHENQKVVKRWSWTLPRLCQLKGKLKNCVWTWTQRVYYLLSEGIGCLTIWVKGC